MTQRPATAIGMVVVLVMASACGLLCAAGCGSDASSGPASADEIYDQQFLPALQQWREARAREAAALDAVREVWNGESRDLLELTARQRKLDRAAAARREAEREVARHAARLLDEYPFKYQASNAQREFLEVLASDIHKLLNRRLGLRDQYSRPLSHVEHQLLQQEHRTLEEQIARRFTRLQEQFPDSTVVRELDRQVVYPRYEGLMEALADIDAGTAVPVPGEDRYTRVLAELAEMKRLYPYSRWTRKAERYIVPRTARRDVTDLRGWPAAVFFGCLALLLVGFGRALAGYMANRQREEEQAESRVFRPAPWVRRQPDVSATGATGPAGPTGSGRQPAPPSPLLPRRDAASSEVAVVSPGVRPPTPRPRPAVSSATQPVPDDRDANGQTDSPDSGRYADSLRNADGIRDDSPDTFGTAPSGDTGSDDSGSGIDPPTGPAAAHGETDDRAPVTGPRPDPTAPGGHDGSTTDLQLESSPDSGDGDGDDPTPVIRLSSADPAPDDRLRG